MGASKNVIRASVFFSSKSNLYFTCLNGQVLTKTYVHVAPCFTLKKNLSCMALHATCISVFDKV